MSAVHPPRAPRSASTPAAGPGTPAPSAHAAVATAAATSAAVASASAAVVAPPAAEAPLRLRVFRFVADPVTGAAARRRFAHPRPAAAIEIFDGAACGGPALAGELSVAFVADAWGPGALKAGEAWLTEPDPHPQPAAISADRDGIALAWRPGRALVSGRSDRHEAALDAAVEFAFYEGRLRAMEETLAACEESAAADVARSYRIRYRDRRHWSRFGEWIETCGRMRLEFARLEHRLLRPADDLSREAQPLFARLLAKAGMEDRLEEFSDRLEACEDLYEGANDRVSDHRWYVGGHALEVSILLMLLIEAGLMAADIALRSGR